MRTISLLLFLLSLGAGTWAALETRADLMRAAAVVAR